MSKGSIAAVIFDLGDTLAHLNLPQDEAEYRALYEAIQRSVASRFAEVGGQISAEILQNVGGRVGQHIAQSYAQAGNERLRECDALALFRTALTEFAPQVQPSDELLKFIIAGEEQIINRRTLAARAIDTLRELRARGVGVGLCSNYFGLPEVARANVFRLGLLDHIDQTVFSCEVGWRKPDPAIYQAICRKLAVRPGECLFVGDRLLEDVRGPQQLGMRAALTREFRHEHHDDAVARPEYVIDNIGAVLGIVAGQAAVGSGAG